MVGISIYAQKIRHTMIIWNAGVKLYFVQLFFALILQAVPDWNRNPPDSRCIYRRFHSRPEATASEASLPLRISMSFSAKGIAVAGPIEVMMFSSTTTISS